MFFTSYTKTDASYTFNGADGEKVIVPATDVIMVDDGSGVITVKTIASRSVLGYLNK